MSYRVIPHHHLSPSQLFQSQHFLKSIHLLSPSLETFFVRNIKPQTQSSQVCCWIYCLLSAEEDYFNLVSTRLTQKEVVISCKKSKGGTTLSLVNSVTQDHRNQVLYICLLLPPLPMSLVLSLASHLSLQQQPHPHGNVQMQRRSLCKIWGVSF